MKSRYRRLLVTGGAGFIGSSFVRLCLQKDSDCACLVNLDCLTYAASLDNVQEVVQDPRYHFVLGRIEDEALVERLCMEHRIEAIVHFAAETHVDRSIVDSRAFLETNVLGTRALLEVVRRHPLIHFHHISTDEVYGSLGETGCFTEASPYAPNSPYAASKAASDHVVRAYGHTYRLSYTLSHCSNNYGPCQHNEKLIPHMIERLQSKRPLPLYGEGKQVRDWIFVEDHSEAVLAILHRGRRGETYVIGAECEKSNVELLYELIDVWAGLYGDDPAQLRRLLTFVPDRPGHDFRYAICPRKMREELGWKPRCNLQQGLHRTVTWYQGRRLARIEN